jgi:uncharacterized protein (TIGR02996 family)
MTPEIAFLQAIHSDPDDRLTYAVFGDWLEEQGDARADLLRALLALREQNPETVPARTREVGELLAGPAGARLRRLKGIGEPRPDPRGLLRMKPGGVPPTDAPDRPEWSWITEVEVARVSKLRKLGEVVERLRLLRRVTLRPAPGQMGHPQWLQFSFEASRPLELRLDLTGHPWNPRDFPLLVAALPPGWLRELAWPMAIHHHFVTQFLQVPGLERLRRLELDQSYLGIPGAQAIAAANLPELKTLSLERTQIQDPGLLAILNAPGLPALRELHVASSGVTPFGLAALMRSRCGPAPLVEFDNGPEHHFRQTFLPEGPRVEVTGTALDRQCWVGHFLSLSLAEGVHSLRLTRLPPCQPGDLASVLTMSPLARLRSLHLGCDGLLPVGSVRELLGSPAGESLEELSLYPSALMPESFAALVRSPLFGSARAIEVRGHGDAGLRLAVGSGRVELVLRRPGLRLLDALPTAPGLRRVTHLRIEMPGQSRVDRVLRVARLLPARTVSFTLEAAPLEEEELTELLSVLPTARLREVYLPLSAVPADHPALTELRRRVPIVQGNA